MKAKKRFLSQAAKSERGASLVDYGLLLACITVASYLALQVLGSQVKGKMCSAADGFNGVNGGANLPSAEDTCVAGGQIINGDG